MASDKSGRWNQSSTTVASTSAKMRPFDTAIAARDLTESNAPRYVLREAMTAVSNGFIFAVVLAAVVQLWFGTALLALAIALAFVMPGSAGSASYLAAAA